MVAILNEPDTGTAWEIGGAYFLQRPEYRVIGFYTNQPELNLMLQQCLHAVTHSAGDLEHRLNSYVQGRMK
jgi:nucleoside 2-deoxyribosyltransferase